MNVTLHEAAKIVGRSPQFLRNRYEKDPKFPNVKAMKPARNGYTTSTQMFNIDELRAYVEACGTKIKRTNIQRIEKLRPMNAQFNLHAMRFLSGQYDTDERKRQRPVGINPEERKIVHVIGDI